MKTKYKLMDLFCGAGGLSNGFHQTKRFNINFGLDNIDDCIKSFLENHPRSHGLIKKIHEVSNNEISQINNEYGPFDIIIGGPPCVGFSSLRPFRSIKENTKNNLYEEFGRVINQIKPNVFIMENVVGLLTHRKGKSIELIIKEFKNLGYNIRYTVLNAVHFGVPQRRERVFIIGSKNDYIPYPLPTHSYENGRSMAKKKVRLVVNNSIQKKLVNNKNGVNMLSSGLTVVDAIGDLPELKSGGEATEYNEQYEMNAYQMARRKKLKKLSLHKSTSHTKKMLEIIRLSGSSKAALPEGMTTSGFSTSYSRLDPDEPSVTLTVNFVHPASNKCIHPYQDRALTPREGARIQSFDDDYVFIGSRSSIVRQIGNAVPPLLSKAIAQEVAESLDSN